MKQTFLLSLLACLFIFAQCKKDKQSSTSDNPYGLPNATQEGKNTLGFLLNGVPWTPKGFNGTANLSIEFDEGVNEGIFGISGYNTTQNVNVGFGIKDSLNFLTAPISVPLNSNGLFQIGIATSSCSIDYYDVNVVRSGQLNLTKIDRVNRIISGRFNATLSKSGCEIINITEGRFDMSY
jgi:hypothetical protein